MQTAIIVAAVMLSMATAAFAQVGRIGSTIVPKPYDGTPTRWPFVSYDGANDAYLVVWGMLPIGARFVSADGVPLGSPVQVSTSDNGDRQPSAVRVACGAEANECLVAWIEENPYEVVGRLLRYNGGEVQFLTAPFSINLNGNHKDTESSATVAYSSAANEFIVAWAEYSPGDGWPDVKAQRVTASGTLAGDEIPIAVNGGKWEGKPSATYNSLLNEYVVAYYRETTLGYIVMQRVQPGTGALIGTNTVYYSSFDQYPEIAYNSQQNNYLLISWGFPSYAAGWMLHGHLADANGDAIGDTLSLAALGGGDGMGLAYNPIRNSYFGVFQSQQNDEVWGVEVSSAGTPGNQFQVTTWGATGGSSLSVQPRTAASTRDGRFLAVTSAAFRRVVGQLLGDGGDTTSTLPPPPPPPDPVPCTSPQPGADWTCNTSTGGWLPPTTQSTDTSTSGCTSTKPAADWVCVSGNWVPPSSGGTSSGGSTSGCPSIQPGADWVCVGGNWLPPGSGGTSGGTGTNTSGCPTIQPGADWVCVGGNWLPPGSGGTSGGTGTNSGCPTIQPGANWVCVGGNWLPPGSGGTSGGTGTNTSGCPTIQPGADWVCVGGNWLPPGSGGTSGGTGTSTSGCPSIQPGADWVCVGGNWLPPGSGGTGTSTSGCPSIQPGADWVCVGGNWLPPGMISSTSACPSIRPGADWTCDAATGNWLPPTTSAAMSTSGPRPWLGPRPDWTRRPTIDDRVSPDYFAVARA